MGSRRLPPLLALLLLFGLMAGALWLVLDGESPWSLLPGGAEPVTTARGDGGPPPPGSARTAVAGGRRRGRPGHLSGDVRDLRTREAAAGRVVTLILADGDVRQVTTDARGRFAFGDVTPDRPHELRVDGADHAPVARPGLFLRPGERLDVGTLWLADGVRVALEVRAFDGRALRGATVRAFAPGAGTGAFDARRGPSPVAIARTGADGIGYFEGLPPGTWTFTAERGGYARRGLVAATVRQGVAEQHFELALEQGHRLDGRVLDAAGSAVAGAPVLAIRRTLPSNATTAPLALRTVTDREGRFVFGTLPAADVVLWAGWPRGRLGVVAAVRLPGVADLDIVLLRGGRLEGVVARAEDGRPVPRAAVLVSLQVLGTFALALEAETDADGRYALDLPMPGTVTSISAERAGYRTEWAELDDERTVGAGMEVRHDLTLERGGVITGRVVGPEGALVGAEVGATNPEWYFSATTDRDGRFTLPGVPRERFFVMASLWGYTMPDRPDDPDGALEDGTAPARFVVDLAKAATGEVEIAMLPGTMVRGRVMTRDGKPAAGAVVAAAGGGPAARAEADGTFVIGPLAAGEQEITATAAGGAAVAGVTVLVPAPPATADAVIVRLGPELRVRGRLTSASGTALSGAYVQIVRWDDSLDDPVGDEWNWLKVPRLTVNGDGSFEHSVNGAPGDYVVRAGALGHRRRRSRRLTLAAARPEVLVELELELGATFAGRVIAAAGDAVPGAYVTAVAVAPGTTADDVGYPGAWGPPIVAVTDASGAFRVSGLDPGLHVIRAWAAGYSSQARVVSVPEDSGAAFVIAPEPDTTDR